MKNNWILNVDISRKHSTRTDGDNTAVSQIANAGASVITRKDSYVSNCIMKTTRNLLQELFKAQRARVYPKASSTKSPSDRATSPEMVSQGEGLVATFEIVPRAQATPHTALRKVFMRVLNLSSAECGCLLRKLGLRPVTNSKRIKVTTSGEMH